MKKRPRRDSQVTELQGRGRLVGELLMRGEVALPARDRGVDLVAYIDLKTSTLEFRARHVQMKAASTRHFSVSKRYARIRDLILAFVWHLNDEHPPVTYAMSYPDAVSVARKMGNTATCSWKGRRRLQYTESEQAIAEVARAPSHEWKKIARIDQLVVTPNNRLER